jgi:hypothetical protein
MNLDNLQHKLIAAARVAQPSDRVPYAFEKRVMARLAEVRADLLGAWSHALWRAAILCVAVMLLSGAWTFFSDDAADSFIGDSSSRDFAQEFESTLLVSAYSGTDSSW